MPATPGSTVTIMGGIGSFGTAMAAYLLCQDVGEARILSRDESMQDEMRRVIAKRVAVLDWLVGVPLMPTAESHAVGGFDEGFFMMFEEVDPQRRLRASGVPSVLLGAPVALHEGGGSSDTDRQRAWWVESRLRYAEKWGHRRRLVMALGAATLINLTWNAGRRGLGRDVHPVTTARVELSLLGIGSKA